MKKKIIIVMAMIFALAFTSSAATCPGKVTGVKVSATSYSKINVSWSKVKNVKGYKVYLSKDKNTGYKVCKTVKAGINKATITGLKAKTKYYIKVKAYKTLKVKKHTKYYYSKKATIVSAITKAKPAEKITTRPSSHLQLVDELYKGENIAISELSLNMALGMLVNGASDETLNQLETYYGLTKEEINSFAKDAISYYNSRKNIKAIVANSIWVNQNSFTIDEQFKQINKTNFDAKITALDFNSLEAAKAINKWCGDKTKGLIKEMVSQNDLKDAELALLNALYFKGAWQDPYEGNYLIKNQDFTNANGTKSTVSMLSSKENIYLENNVATGVMKPYNDGIYFVGILPKAEGDFNLADMDVENLIKSPSYKYEVHLKMPEFTVESTVDLDGCLKEMGVNDIFSEEDAKLSGVGEALSQGNLFVSLIKQKAVVKLNKDGTEAAAVTAIVMKATSIGPGKTPQIKEVTLNRPYAFLIYDKKNDVILFEGKIVKK